MFSSYNLLHVALDTQTPENHHEPVVLRGSIRKKPFLFIASTVYEAGRKASTVYEAGRKASTAYEADRTDL